MTQDKEAGVSSKDAGSQYGRFGIILGVIGVLLAIDTLTGMSFFYKFWPLIVALPGAGFIGLFVRRARKESLYLGVGLYLLGFSCMALYCSFTSWRAMAELWPLFITLLGISVCSGYAISRQSPIQLLGGMLLISLSLYFIFVFSISGRLWWSIFLLAGFSFVVFDRVKNKK